MSRVSELVDTIRPDSVVESLIKPDGDQQTKSFSKKATDIIRSRNRNVERPDENLEEYYRLYKENPLINGTINRAAQEVMEPGWWVEADSAKTEEEITEFLENCGIVGAQTRRNFSELAVQAIIQYWVRGTFLAEKTTNSNGRHNGLSPVQVQTYQVQTKSGNALLAPEDTQYDDILLTTDGRAAAYVQYTSDDEHWGSHRERRFARDEILHWNRKPDINDVFGNSRIEPIYERALALEAKVRDNDDAIAMKAWPGIIFQLGTSENPWVDDEMDDFMDDYDQGNFGPGMMQGVPGDIEVEEFAGETADIYDAVETDVNLIISGLPGPKYALGGFNDGDMGETVASSQERQFRRLVRSLRRDMEDLFTPYIVDVANDWDLDDRGLQLHIGREGTDINPEDVNNNVIQYSSDANNGSNQNEQPEEPPEKTEAQKKDEERSDTRDRNRQPKVTPTEMSSHSPSDLETAELSAVEPHPEAEELSDPRLVATDSVVDKLADVITSTMMQARDAAIDRGTQQFVRDGDVVPDAGSIESTFNAQLNSALLDSNIQNDVQDDLRDVGRRTLDTLGQNSHSPQIEQQFSRAYSDIAQQASRHLIDDLRNVGDDVGTKMSTQMQDVADSEQSIGVWADRIRNDLDDAHFKQRARTIARMRAKTLINKIKLTAYQNDDRVLGVEVVNPCTEKTTKLCQSLAGCDGGNAKAYFHLDPDLGEQLTGQTDQDLFTGFDPLPAIPPFHFNCRSEIVPITKDPDQ